MPNCSLLSNVCSLLVAGALGFSSAHAQGPDNPPVDPPEITITDFVVYQKVAAKDSSGITISGGVKMREHRTGEAMQMVRSEDGSFTIYAEYAASAGEADARLVLIGVPGSAPIYGTTGDTDHTWTFKWSDYALSQQRMSVAVINSVSLELIEKVPLLLPWLKYAPGHSWGWFDEIDTTPRLIPSLYQEYCRTCSEDYDGETVANNQLTGVNCVAGYLVPLTTSDNGVEAIIGGGTTDNGKGTSGLTHTANDLSSSSSGSPAGNLTVRATAGTVVHMAGSGGASDYPAKLVSATGTLTVTDDTGGSVYGYTVKFFKVGDDPSADDPQTCVVVRWVNEGSGVYGLRFIEERFGGTVVETKYTYEEGTGDAATWILWEGAELDGKTETAASASDFLRKTVIEKSDVDLGLWTEEVTTSEKRADNGTLEVVSVVENTYVDFGWGSPLVKQVLDPDTLGRTRTWTYGNNSGFKLAEGNPISYVDFTGYRWVERWDYTEGRVTGFDEPFLETTAGKITRFTYNGTGYRRFDKVSLNGTAVEERYVIEEAITGGTRTKLKRLGTLGGGVSEADSLVTWVERKDAASSGGNPTADSFEVTSVIYEDGTQKTCSYSYVTVGGEPQRLVECKTGSAAGTAGVRTKSWSDAMGNLVKRESYALDFGGTTSSTGTLLKTETYGTLDGIGRPTAMTCDFADSNSASQTRSWIYGCCGLKQKTDTRGVVTDYHRDHLKRLETTTKLGVTTGILYNGLEILKVRIPAADAPIVSGHKVVRGQTLPSTTYHRSKVTHNKASERTSRALSSPQHTDQTTLQSASYAYSYGSGVTVTVTYPDGGTEIIATHRDGRVEDVSGTAINNHSYTYGTTLSGVTFSNGAVLGAKRIEENGTQWAASMSNSLGQGVLTYYADGSTSTRHYNGKGQLGKSIDPDGVTTFFAYNDEGQRVFSIGDLDGDGIDYDDDRVIFSEGNYGNAVENGYYAYEAVSRVYRDENGSIDDKSSNASSPDGLLVRVRQRSVDGLHLWSQPYNDSDRRLDSEIELSGGGDWTVTTVTGDGQTSVETYTAGLLGDQIVKGNSTTGAEVISDLTYAYDEHNRVKTLTDERTKLTKFNYYNDGRLKDSTLERTVATTDDDLTNSYTYDKMGRTLTVTFPETIKGGANALSENKIERTYDKRGNVLTVSGEQTYDLTATYDALSRIETLKTTHGSGTGSGDSTTTWGYDSQRGWLESKRDNDSQGPDYDYTDGGRLKTREWARGGGSKVTTTYGYDFEPGGTSAVVGDLISVTYTNDGDVTPDLAYRYTRWGAVDEVDDVAGTREFTYRDSDDLFVETESLSSTDPGALTPVINVPKIHTHTYDGLGRLSTLQWGTSSNADADQSTGYFYHVNTGRLSRVTHDPFGSGDSFDYEYKGNSYLVDTVISTQHTVTNTYATYRDLKTGIQSAVGGSNRTNYQYRYNDFGQREAVSFDGDVYPSSKDGSWIVEYSENGEVASADLYEEVSFTPTTIVDDRDYDYDPIGNRVSYESTAGGSTDTWNYYADTGKTKKGGDSLNQYRRIDTPTGDLDRVHDEDGNLTDDGVLLYKWDAENRLIEVRKKSGNVLIAEYLYDYLGRRVWKEVHSTTTGGVVGEQIFVYCGWNLGAEYTSSAQAITSTTAPQRSYSWGLDLSGSLEGAGGVGGLLVIEEHSGDHLGLHFPAYDGNGNLVSLLDGSTGGAGPYYVFDAFGQTIAEDGPFSYNEVNPFQFSTKYLDRETGFYYYGYRYYDPATGRWPSRDPISELGGLNLYGFLANNGVGGIDYLGLFEKGDGGSGLLDAPTTKPTTKPTPKPRPPKVSPVPWITLVLLSIDSGYQCYYLGHNISELIEIQREIREYEEEDEKDEEDEWEDLLERYKKENEEFIKKLEEETNTVNQPPIVENQDPDGENESSDESEEEESKEEEPEEEESTNDEDEPKAKKKASDTAPGGRVRTPTTHREDFYRNRSGQYVNRKTKEIWERSHTNHNSGDEYKVGLKPGHTPRPRHKITVDGGGTVIKVDK